TAQWQPVLSPEYLRDHALRPVLFGAAVERMAGEGFDTFVEIGHGATLSGAAHAAAAAATADTAADADATASTADTAADATADAASAAAAGAGVRRAGGPDARGGGDTGTEGSPSGGGSGPCGRVMVIPALPGDSGDRPLRHD
ncbi:hypothetical protein RND15_52705, partial [Streptomyces sp. DSM 41529]